MSVATTILERDQPNPIPSEPDWSYEEAFSRNLGLLTQADQEKLRHSHVAIAGMGGVGGVHLMTLTRLGIGKFTIADPDVFEVGNFNRQCGANMRTIGKNKAEVMANEARLVNPEVEIRVLPEAITQQNVSDFLPGADILVDGVDFFSIEARRLLFRSAHELGIWAITAGPIGFSTAWLTFDPNGMTFDRYFDLRDDMERLDQLIALAVGLTPKATQRAYLDLSRVDLQSRRAPCSSLACQLASGVAAAEIAKVLCSRGKVKAAPYYAQLDPFCGRYCHGRMLGGNRNPIQRLKRWWLRRLWNATRQAH